MIYYKGNTWVKINYDRRHLGSTLISCSISKKEDNRQRVYDFEGHLAMGTAEGILFGHRGACQPQDLGKHLENLMIATFTTLT